MPAIQRFNPPTHLIGGRGSQNPMILIYLAFMQRNKQSDKFDASRKVAYRDANLNERIFLCPLTTTDRGAILAEPHQC